MSCNYKCNQGRKCDCCHDQVPEGFMLAVATIVGLPLMALIIYLVVYGL